MIVYLTNEHMGEVKCVMEATYRLSAKESLERLEAQADWLEKLALVTPQ